MLPQPLFLREPQVTSPKFHNSSQIFASDNKTQTLLHQRITQQPQLKLEPPLIWQLARVTKPHQLPVFALFGKALALPK